MRNVFALLKARTVSVPVAAARPTSLVADGVDITSWRADGTYAGQLAAVFVNGNAAMTITSPTGGAKGVELWGAISVGPGPTGWWRIGYLNDGEDIDIASATTGYATEVNVLGIFDRLAIAGTPSTGAASARAAPVESFS